MYVLLLESRDKGNGPPIILVLGKGISKKMKKETCVPVIDILGGTPVYLRINAGLDPHS